MSVLFAQHESDVDVCESGSNLLRLYLIGVMVLLSLTLIVTLTLIVHSARGSIMNTEPRKHVPNIIILRYDSDISNTIEY